MVDIFVLKAIETVSYQLNMIQTIYSIFVLLDNDVVIWICIIQINVNIFNCKKIDPKCYWKQKNKKNKHIRVLNEVLYHKNSKMRVLWHCNNWKIDSILWYTSFEPWFVVINSIEDLFKINKYAISKVIFIKSLYYWLS